METLERLANKIKKEMTRIHINAKLIKRYNRILDCEPSDMDECASYSSNMRMLMDQFLIELANRILEFNKETKLKDINSKNTAREYLSELKVIGRGGKYFVDGLYFLLNARGGSHNMLTSQEDFESMRRILLEVLSMLLIKSKSHLPRGEYIKENTPAISKKQFEKLLSKTKNQHHKIFFLLAFGSGLKVSEVVNLKREYFDFENQELNLPNREISIPLEGRFKEEHLKEIIPPKCVARALQKAVRASAEEAGILDENPNFSFRSLRKGFARQLFISNVPHHEIQQLLGHKTIVQTSVLLEEIRKDEEDITETPI